MTFLPDRIGDPGAGLGEGGQPPANTQAFYQDLSKLSPRAKSGPKAEPYYQVFDLGINGAVGLAAGQEMKIRSESGIPDYWIISTRPVANTKISIFLGPQDQGSPHRLGGGGTAKLPGLTEDLTILCEAGAATAIGTVIGCRGYDVSLSGGNV